MTKSRFSSVYYAEKRNVYFRGKHVSDPTAVFGS